MSFLDRRPLGRENRTREGIGRRIVDEPERVVPALLVVDVCSDYRAEELVPQEAEALVLRRDHGRLHEVALRVVRRAAGEDLRAGRARLGDRVGVGLERRRVDHRAHEVLEVGRVAHLDRRDVRDEPLLHLGPDIGRHVQARRRRALLALVLERAAHDRGRNGFRLGGGMSQDEVLAARLADDSRVVAV